MRNQWARRSWGRKCMYMLLESYFSSDSIKQEIQDVTIMINNKIIPENDGKATIIVLNEILKDAYKRRYS